MSEEGGGHDERWVISYADLVTLLLGFFIILYSSAQLDIEKFQDVSLGLAAAFNVDVKEGLDGGRTIFEGGHGIVPGPLNNDILDLELEELRAQLNQQAIANGIDEEFVVTRDDDRIVIRLADSLIFGSASADLRPEAVPLLEVIGEVLRELPNNIRVEGHTDNVPIHTSQFPSNWELSTARATSVVRFLAEQAGVAPERLFAAGFGEFQPVASNNTPEGRALNRRADVVVLYPAPEGPLDDSLELPSLQPVRPEIGPEAEPLVPSIDPFADDDSTDGTAADPAAGAGEE